MARRNLVRGDNFLRRGSPGQAFARGRNMEFSNQDILFAFALTMGAGLSTGIGSCLAFMAKRANTSFLCVSLGFSAGVMLYVSFVEILGQANQSLSAGLGAVGGAWATAGAFFGGIVFIGAIDRLVPSYENPHEARLPEDMQNSVRLRQLRKAGSGPESPALDGLRRTGVFTALAIGIHNFPEGLATFTMALAEPGASIAIAVAIAIHNIPEGIAVSVPLYYATGSRKKAFFYSFASGLAEPAGAVIGFLILLPFFSPTVFGLLFAGVAGIMVFISLDELLPAAERYGEHHLCIYGLLAGMAVMALSLLLML